MKRKVLDIFLIAFFILLVIGFIMAYSFYKSEGNECISDPLNYAQKLTNTSCGCYGDGSLNGAAFYCASQCPSNSLGFDYPK